MLFTTKMVYLGVEPKTSKKTQKAYLMGKFMEIETSTIFEFYIPSDRIQLVTDLGGLSQFTPVGVKLEMTSYQGNVQVDLVGVQK
jgi:hypothetical protein